MEWPSRFDRGPKINTPGCLDREAIAEVQPCLTFALFVCLLLGFCEDILISLNMSTGLHFERHC